MDMGGRDEQLGHGMYHALVVHHDPPGGVSNRELVNVPRK